MKVKDKIKRSFSKVSESIMKVKNKKIKKINRVKTIKDEKYLKTVSDIFQNLHKGENYRIAILGVGNDLKGDDGIGWYVVDKLAKIFKEDKNLLLIKTSVPENHTKEIREFAPNILIIIDAADFKERPGTIKYITEDQISDTFISTHTTPLTVFLRLYQEDMPIKKPVFIIGIQKKTVEFGQSITPQVKKSGDLIANLIVKLYKEKTISESLREELEYLSNPLRKLKKIVKKK